VCVSVCRYFFPCPCETHPALVSSHMLHCSDDDNDDDDDDRILTVFSNCYWLWCESHNSRRKWGNKRKEM